MASVPQLERRYAFGPARPARAPKKVYGSLPGVPAAIKNVFSLGESQHPGSVRAYGRGVAASMDPRTPEGVASIAGLFVPGPGGGRYAMSRADLQAVDDFKAGYTTRGDMLESPVVPPGALNPQPPWGSQRGFYQASVGRQIKSAVGPDWMNKVEAGLRAGTGYALPKYRKQMDDFVKTVMATAASGNYRGAAKMVSDVATQFNGPNRAAARHLIDAQTILDHLYRAKNFGHTVESAPMRGGESHNKVRAAIEQHLDDYSGR